MRTLINTSVRMVYPFLAVFGRGLGVGLPQMTWAVTIRALAGGMGPFLAFIADSRGRKRGMLLGVALFTLGTACVAFWPTYWGFVLALMLSILGNFVLIPALQAYLGDRVPYARRGLALSVTEFGWSLSFILGVPLVGLAISRLGPLAPFSIMTGLGALSLALLAWLLPSDAASAPFQPSDLVRNLWLVVSSPPALSGLLAGLALSAANDSINLISGVWMENTFGLRISELGLAFAMIGFSELGGEVLVSVLSDRLGKIFAVSAGLVGNSLAVMALAFLGRSLPTALACMFLFYLTFEFAMVSSIPLMTEALPQARATTMAAYIGMLSLGRAVGAQTSAPLFSYGQTLRLPGMASAGILLIAVLVVSFNFLAILALRRLSTLEESRHAQV